MASARAAHEEALDALDRAQRDLDESERDVAELERYVSELEARGEDPAKHAFEGMERFNPVLDRFLPRAAALEQAEVDEAASRALLEAAEADLEAAGRQAPDD